jgi:outer membrane receptor protein involved in Fe transport
LRNLGFQRTLVLFDGARVVTSTAQGGVDLTTLPSNVISRVDVVTGGASASWGSDALAGVVNLVVDHNITGFKSTIQGGETVAGVRDIFAQAAAGQDIFGGRGHIEIAASAEQRPDTELLTDAQWYQGAYWVSNPAYAAGNGQPQFVVATNVGLANATPGGIINASPAVTAANSPSGVAVPANYLKGIQFVGAGNLEQVNYGNVTANALSNGGSLNTRTTQAPLTAISEPSNTYTLFADARYRLTDTIEASIQLNYGYFTGLSESLAAANTNLTIHGDNAFIPAALQSTLQNTGIPSFTLGTLNVNNYNLQTASGSDLYRNANDQLAPGIYHNRRNLMRGVFGLDGTLGGDWSWKADIESSGARYSVHTQGEPITANLLNAIDSVVVTPANVGTSGLPLGSIACRSTLTGKQVTSGFVTSQPGCIPLNVFGTGVASPAAIAYVTGASTGSRAYDHESLAQFVAEATMQGTLPWQLPAGKVAVAFGTDYRKESGRTEVPPIAALNGYNGANGLVLPDSSYDVVEGFAEVNAPILKDNIVNSLDFSMAGRITNYSTSGVIETWKLGATSQVNEDIKLRTTWSVDIRAPQLSDLYSTGTGGTVPLTDPKTNLVVPVLVQKPGNPNLLPEVARTVSGGVVLTPHFIPGFRMSADWYSIDITNLITSLNENFIVAECNPTVPSQIHPGQNGNLNQPLCSGLVFNGPNGALSQLHDPELNFAKYTVSGLDMAANYDTDLWDGSLSLAAMANLTDEYTQTQPGLGANDIAGSFTQQHPSLGLYNAGPKWRGVLTATYKIGPYSFTAQGRWYGTAVMYQDGNTGDNASAATALKYDPAHFEVPAVVFLDLRGSYDFSPNYSLFWAIDNALNIPPPLVVPTTSATTAGFDAYFNTDAGLYGVLGRNVRLGIRVAL